MSNVDDDESQVVHLNGLHDKAPEYLVCLAKPKVVFGTDTSLTTEQTWGGASPNDQRVRQQLVALKPNKVLPPSDWSAPLSGP